MRSAHALSTALLLALAGCHTETLFQEDFNATPIGAAPAANQATGSASTFGPDGAVLIVQGPPGSSDHWLAVGRANNALPIAGMTGTLTAIKGPGTYHFSSAMLMPGESQTATIEFDAFGPTGNGNRLEFLHLDFRADNHVRIDDTPASDFGTFPRDTPFDVFVTLNTAASPPTAHIALIGAGATGTVDYTIAAPSLAASFNSFTVWMGYPWTGSFISTGETVTHDLP